MDPLQDDHPAFNPFAQQMSSEDILNDSTSSPLPVVQKARADSLASVKHLQHEALEEPSTITSTLQIQVGEPVTVGEGMSSYTSYKITSNSESGEFLWLNEKLRENNPGIIIPPPPEKHAIGRFDQDFVANRRIQLERMLKKIAANSVLQKDKDFQLFLESENLKVDVEVKKTTPSKGLFSKLSDVMSNVSITNVKIPEPDNYFETKKSYLENLENQLKILSKAVDGIMKQREDLGNATQEFGESIITLASTEINKSLEKNLTSFANVQKKLKSLHDQQATQDLFYMHNTIDEYIRIIHEIYQTFQTRTKTYQTYHTSESNLAKLKISLEKAKLLAVTNKSSADKISTLEAEILDAESRVMNHKKEFDEVTRVVKEELERFEREKVEDVQFAMRGFLESMLITQRKIVELWDTYFVEAQ